MTRGSFRPALVAILMIGAILGCEPTDMPIGGQPTSGVSPAGGTAAPGSPPVAGAPAVTIDGSVVRIAGLGSGVSPEFELPAGSAAMTVSVCTSNQVIPFVTLYDANDTKLGLIVQPTYQLRNLVGGAYYVDVATNPTCGWTIEVTPD